MIAFFLGTSIGRLILAVIIATGVGLAAFAFGDYHGRKIAHAADAASFAKLEAGYAAASATAEQAARDAQAQADAAQIAQEKALAASAAEQASMLTAKAAKAMASLAAFKRHTQEARKHDPSAARWLDAIPPHSLSLRSGAN